VLLRRKSFTGGGLQNIRFCFHYKNRREESWGDERPALRASERKIKAKWPSINRASTILSNIRMGEKREGRATENGQQSEKGRKEPPLIRKSA